MPQFFKRLQISHLKPNRPVGLAFKIDNLVYKLFLVNVENKLAELFGSLVAPRALCFLSFSVSQRQEASSNLSDSTGLFRFGALVPQC